MTPEESRSKAQAALGHYPPSLVGHKDPCGRCVQVESVAAAFLAVEADALARGEWRGLRRGHANKGEYWYDRAQVLESELAKMSGYADTWAAKAGKAMRELAEARKRLGEAIAILRLLMPAGQDHLIYCPGPLPPPNAGCIDNRCEDIREFLAQQEAPK